MSRLVLLLNQHLKKGCLRSRWTHVVHVDTTGFNADVHVDTTGFNADDHVGMMGNDSHVLTDVHMDITYLNKDVHVDKVPIESMSTLVLCAVHFPLVL